MRDNVLYIFFYQKRFNFIFIRFNKKERINNKELQKKF